MITKLKLFTNKGKVINVTYNAQTKVFVTAPTTAPQEEQEIAEVFRQMLTYYKEGYECLIER